MKQAPLVRYGLLSREIPYFEVVLWDRASASTLRGRESRRAGGVDP